MIFIFTNWPLTHLSSLAVTAIYRPGLYKRQTEKISCCDFILCRPFIAWRLLDRFTFVIFFSSFQWPHGSKNSHTLVITSSWWSGVCFPLQVNHSSVSILFLTLPPHSVTEIRQSTHENIRTHTRTMTNNALAIWVHNQWLLFVIPYQSLGRCTCKNACLFKRFLGASVEWVQFYLYPYIHCND